MKDQSRQVIYWSATLLLCAQTLFAAFAYLTRLPAANEAFASLGYPSYFQIILGVAKIAGVAALLVGGFPLLKEWAYAGFLFTFVGAVISHAVRHEIPLIIPPVIASVLLTISYGMRPAGRRLNAVTANQPTRDTRDALHAISPRPASRQFMEHS